MVEKLCYTCENDQVQLITLYYNGMKINTLLEKADDSIPMWFKKAGIYSPLPRALTCQSKYNPFKNKISNWKSDFPTQTGLKIKITSSTLKKMGYGQNQKYPRWMYFWASKHRDFNQVCPLDAEPAYGNFYNSGLVEINKDGNFIFNMYLPTPYLVDGIMYTPHLHLAFLGKDRVWEVNTWTITIFPHLLRDKVKELKDTGKYLFISDLSDISDENIKAKVSQDKKLTKVFLQKNSIFQVPIVLSGKDSYICGDLLLKMGYTNLIYNLDKVK